MKQILLPISLLLILATAACHREPVQILPPENGPVYPTDTFQNIGPIQFSDLQVGQQSRYQFFYCTQYGNPAAATQTYQADTLVVAITGEDADGFIVRELLTEGSASRNGATNVYDADTMYTYHLRVTQDTLFVIKPAANLGWFSGSRIFVSPAQALPLAPVSSPQTEFSGWQTTLFNNGLYQQAFVTNFELNGQTFDFLNILSDNRDMQVDGPGFLYAYAGAYGLVRWAHYSPWTSNGSGWDLLGQ